MSAAVRLSWGRIRAERVDRLPGSKEVLLVVSVG